MTIQEAIQKMVSSLIKPDILLAKVIEFDTDKWLATVELNTTLKIDEVRVRAVVNTELNGMFIEPKVGSYVLVGLIEGKIENLFVITFSEIVKYHLKADLIEFNGDSFGGMIKIDNLIEKLNQLEENFLTHIHSNSAGPTGTPQDASMAPITFLPTQKSELENETIKHG